MLKLHTMGRACERSGDRHIFHSPFKPISVTPALRSIPRCATSRSTSAPVNFFTSVHRLAPAHLQVFGQLRFGSRSAPAPVQCFKKQPGCISKSKTDIWPTVGKANAIFRLIHRCVRPCVCNKRYLWRNGWTDRARGPGAMAPTEPWLTQLWGQWRHTLSHAHPSFWP